MAAPTWLVQLEILVLSYTTFGYAVVISEIMLMAKHLFTKIWFGISPVTRLCPW